MFNVWNMFRGLKITLLVNIWAPIGFGFLVIFAFHFIIISIDSKFSISLTVYRSFIKRWNWSLFVSNILKNSPTISFLNSPKPHSEKTYKLMPKNLKVTNFEMTIAKLNIILNKMQCQYYFSFECISPAESTMLVKICMC